MTRARVYAHMFGLAIAHRLNRAAMMQQAQDEHQVVRGRCLGLADEDAREVVAYWHHLGTADDDLIFESLTRRACGERWHPPSRKEQP